MNGQSDMEVQSIDHGLGYDRGVEVLCEVENKIFKRVPHQQASYRVKFRIWRRSLPVILGGWGVRRVFTASVIWSFFFVTLLFSFGDPVHYPGLLQFLGY